MRAWVDESARKDGAALPMYLLGASLTSVDVEQDAAEMLQALAPRGRKLHWRELGDRGRAKAADLLPNLGICHVVVIATPRHLGVKQERARGLCFERLMWELAERGVDQVTFESRSSAQDRTDRRRIDGLRGRRLIPQSLRADWVPGPTQPLLWSPDLLLGVVGTARASGGPLPAELATLVTEIRIDL